MIGRVSERLKAAGKACRGHCENRAFTFQHPRRFFSGKFQMAPSHRIGFCLFCNGTLAPSPLLPSVPQTPCRRRCLAPIRASVLLSSRAVLPAVPPESSVPGCCAPHSVSSLLARARSRTRPLVVPRCAAVPPESSAPGCCAPNSVSSLLARARSSARPLVVPSCAAVPPESSAPGRCAPKSVSSLLARARWSARPRVVPRCAAVSPESFAPGCCGPNSVSSLLARARSSARPLFVPRCAAVPPESSAPGRCALCPEFRVVVAGPRPLERPSSCRPAPRCRLRRFVRPRLCPELRGVFSVSLPFQQSSSSRPSLCCRPRRVVRPCMCPQLRVVVAVSGVSRESPLRSSSLVSSSSSSFVLILTGRPLLAPSRERHAGNTVSVLHAAVSGSPWLRSRGCRRAFSLRLRFAAPAGAAPVVVFWFRTFRRTWVAVFRRRRFWSASRRRLPSTPPPAPPPLSSRLFGFPGAHRGLVLSAPPEAPGSPSSAACRLFFTANFLRAGLSPL